MQAAQDRDSADPDREQVEAFSMACFRMYQLMRRGRTASSQEARGSRERLSDSQFMLLSPLVEQGDQTVGNLARTVGVSQPTATRSLNDLEAKGLITRSYSTGSDRTAVVHITDQGKRAWTSTRAVIRTIQEDTLDHIPVDDRRAVIDALNLVADAIARRYQ